jgi:hypothetical protein
MAALDLHKLEHAKRLIAQVNASPYITGFTGWPCTGLACRQDHPLTGAKSRREPTSAACGRSLSTKWLDVFNFNAHLF